MTDQNDQVEQRIFIGQERCDVLLDLFKIGKSEYKKEFSSHSYKREFTEAVRFDKKLKVISELSERLLKLKRSMKWL